ncbi:Nucleoside-diphosphate-sugar epimerase [Saccharopolyspora antimicrobica]|uniref:Nucleoside-diphosphate-sugar epimerase n=2 Tax=Saccharopolyspora antimicrobica TaxID=455193 RepID=A0A1I4Y6U9_9PSEU|nr:nucleoside-diphosphate-sugar epimerase [Saccharopolyspora antimicrobica]SFN33735.1 Nucleoside-diphosphate-sugar epimerase [Saccharopolyspora antimicrobica]
MKRTAMSVSDINPLKGVPMRVFVTGASGWVGSAVVPELVAAGHQVTGLARSEASAAAVTAAGATPIRGTVNDPEVLRDAAAASDVVIHLAFPVDLAHAGRMDDAVASDVATIQTLGEALPTGGAIATATGTAGLARNGVPATERDRPAADALIAARQPSDDAALSLTERGLRSSVLRLAPINHGEGDNGFLPTLIQIAREKGFSGYPGDGSARWSAVHVRDTARLFRLAIEAGATGYLHAVAEEGIPLRQIAQAIGRHLDLPVRPVPMSRVDEHFGFLGMFLKSDTPVSSAHTREVIGWAPIQPGLFEEIERGHYFAPDAASDGS